MHKKKKFRYFCLFCLFVFFVLNILHLLRGDILFHSDIARDFLVIDEIISTRKLTLIGPKSGGIPGVFHGPAWYYLNLPFFIIFSGNPALIGLFWVSLYFFALYCFYFIVKSVFNKDFSLLATTLFASLTVFMPKGLMQCAPATFLTIFIAFFIYLYSLNKSISDLLFGLFFIGLSIQFQMAFGVPILIVLGIYLIWFIFKNHKYKHLFSFLILLIPLSSFILFDLRHDFLQIRSVFNYLKPGNSSENFNLFNYLIARFSAIRSSFTFIKSPYSLLNNFSGLFGLLALTFLFFKLNKVKGKRRCFLAISLLMIFGFWIITLPFRGEIRDYYYEMLIPLFCVNLVFFLLIFFKKKIGISILLLIVLVNLISFSKSGYEYIVSSDDKDEAHWKFYRKMAHDVYKDSKSNGFSYYAWTPDLLGYPTKYSMLYFSKKYDINLSSYKKTPITYLLISNNDAKYNPWVNPVYWQENQVKISRNANKEWSYKSGFVVKKYFLSNEEQEIKSDDNLINNLHFR